MSGTHVETIRDVSRTLLDLLKNNMSGVNVALASPKNAGTNRLTLFLYKVTENPDLKNAQHIVERQPNGQLVERRAPLSLDAYYLLTAHAADGDLLEAHQALSKAMAVLNDNGVLQGSLLRADNTQTGLTAQSILRVTLNPISMEDMTRIWSVFPDTQYEISVTYLVTPVEIDSTVDITGAPVVDQIHEQGHYQPALEEAGA
jgi:hypothetical protein